MNVETVLAFQDKSGSCGGAQHRAPNTQQDIKGVRSSFFRLGLLHCVLLRGAVASAASAVRFLVDGSMYIALHRVEPRTLFAGTSKFAITALCRGVGMI